MTLMLWVCLLSVLAAHIQAFRNEILHKLSKWISLHIYTVSSVSILRIFLVFGLGMWHCSYCSAGCKDCSELLKGVKTARRGELQGLLFNRVWCLSVVTIPGKTNE